MDSPATDTSPKRPPGTVITFYSFKGGVGRSMALANIAVLLARAGKRVLCIDWDLEAPGLDRYFRAVPRSTVPRPKAIDVAQITAPTRPGGLLAVLEASTPAQPAPWRDYLHHRITADAPLDFLGSGDDAPDYSARLAAFSWADFFAQREGGAVIEALRTQWKADYDYILVDSRTGLTDASGICSIQMPDLLVLLFAANEQNTHWCERVARSIREGRRALPYERAFLPVIPILARFDAREESDRASAAKDRIAPLFASYFSDWLPAAIPARTMLDWALFPYIPRYNFEEALAVEEEPSAGAQGLSFYYDLLARLILARFQGVRAILATAGVPGAALPPILPGTTELRAELRRDPTAAARYLRAIQERAAEEPIEAAEACEELARLSASLNRYSDAEQALSAAIKILGEPAIDRRDEIPRLLSKQADYLSELGREPDAEARHKEAVAHATDIAGPHSPTTAHALEAFATFLEGHSRRTEAATLLAQAVTAYDQSATPDPSGLRTALERWRDCLFELGRHPEAIPLARRVLDLVQADPNRTSSDEALAWDRYGTALQFGGDPRSAVEPLRQALALEEKDAGSGESVKIGRALNNLANVLHAAGRYADAEPLFRRALAVYEKALGPDHPDVAIACGNLANVLRAAGRYADAEPLLRRALAVYEKALGPDHPHVAAACGNLAWVLRDMGRYADAEPLCRRALAVYEKALGPDHPDVATACGNLANVLRDTGRYADAEPLFRRALAIDEKALGAEHPYVGIDQVYLAQSLSEAGRFVETDELWPQGIGLLKRGYGLRHDRVGRARWHWAEHLERAGRVDEAREQIALAVGILAETVGAEHPNTLKATAVAARLGA